MGVLEWSCSNARIGVGRVKFRHPVDRVYGTGIRYLVHFADSCDSRRGQPISRLRDQTCVISGLKPPGFVAREAAHIIPLERPESVLTFNTARPNRLVGNFR